MSRPDGTGGAQLVKPPDSNSRRFVFISHSREDGAAANAVCAAVEADGVRCWILPRDVRPGQETGWAVSEALRESQLMVVVLSSSANKSESVLHEVERAVKQGMAIVVFRIEEVEASERLDRFIGSGRRVVDGFAPPLGRNLGALVEAVKMALGPVGKR
jgi:hypothetical protein